MTYIWNEELLKKATNIGSGVNWQADHISIDSRLVKENSIFVAYKGEKLDGHDYIDEAISKGASLIIANKMPQDWQYEVPIIIVDDHIDILEKMAAYKRRKFKGKIIAITGTVGKTTTKEAIHHCLSKQSLCFSSFGSFNNKLGLFLSLASLKEMAYDYGVFELGMNQAGEMSFLSNFLKPHIAIITTITPVHMEFFQSIDELAAAKAEILDGMDYKSTLIINKDNEYYEYLVNKAFSKSVTNIYSFGCKSICCFRLIGFELKEHAAKLTIEIEESYNYKFLTNFMNKEIAVNFLAVIGLGYILELDLNIFIENLSNFKPIKGRGEIISLYINDKKITIIDDSYNASPASMQAALNMLGSRKHNGRKIAILGDMKELGAKTLQYHADLNQYVNENMIDKIITCGNFIEQLYNILPNQKKSKHFSNIDDLGKNLYDLVEDNDLILLKASKSMGFSQLIKNLENSYVI